MSEEIINQPEDSLQGVVPVSGMYENWFLDYASYVILERAIPSIEDGLKPVQRRILHAMFELEDGRYNKVANVIGYTMQYHPHGDASIGDAIVGLGQKDLLIDMQGNWGDVRTGDGAAAARYIEARLTKFAQEVIFNPDTTEWQLSYDGRKKEPVNLPVKFPLLLAQGAEGIAVGLSTKVMPHNFCELITASIDILNNKEVTIYPDFITGGMVDVSNYNQGKKGGKIRVRAKIEELDKKTLIIREIPFSTTTTSLMESIVKASETGKIKIKKVVDNTAKNVEVLVYLQPGVSPDITIDALYAFTDCEVSISPNTCIIVKDSPSFTGVNDLLKICTENTKILLQRELEIKRDELMEKVFFSSLEKIFIQEEMYIDFKLYSDKSTLFNYLNKRFDSFKHLFYREIIDEDYEKLTQIPMIRITRFDAFKADEKMKGMEEELVKVNYNLENLTAFAINYFSTLLQRYGKGRERKTEIKTFDVISASVVAAANEKLYVNRVDGFIGIGLKKDEFVSDCSDLDDVIVFFRDGKFKVVKIADKLFVGKDIIHVAIFKKADERMIYNMVYLDSTSGRSMAKRFNVTSITRDREYDLTMGNKGSKVTYFSANPDGEAEKITITLTPSCAAKIKTFNFGFAELEIKGRSAQGNILTKYPVKKIAFKEAGKSTLAGAKLYFDDSMGRLNHEAKGKLIGSFTQEDKILFIDKDGNYEIVAVELSSRFDPNQVILLDKFNSEKIVTVIYLDSSNQYLVKRFKIETSTLDKKFHFLNEGGEVIAASTDKLPQVEVELLKVTGKETNLLDLDVLFEVKGWKSNGTKLSSYKVTKLRLIATKPEDDIEKETLIESELPIEPDNINQLGLF